MTYRYLEDIAIADAAFEAWGRDLEEVFISAADATTNVMVEDLGSILRQEALHIEVEGRALDLLLYSFISEIVFIKDARRLLLRFDKVEIEERDGLYYLRAKAWGSPIDPGRQSLKADVKAVTLHRLSLIETREGWRATAVLDI